MIGYFAFKNYFEKEKEAVKKEFYAHLKVVTKQRVNTALKVLDKVYELKLKDEKDKLKEILNVYLTKKIENPNIYIKVSKTPIKFDKSKFIVISKYINGKYYYIYEPINIVKKSVRNLISTLFDAFRWGKKGYIFVHDTKGKCYYHINKSLIGKNRWNLKRDGVYIVRKLTKEALLHPNGTYVTYLAYNPDGKKPLPKTSYMVYDDNLGLTIGSGIYLNDLNKRLANIEKKKEEIIENIVIKLIILIVCIFLVVSVFIHFSLMFLSSRINFYEKEIKKLEEKECKDSITQLTLRNCINFDSKNKFAVIDININDFKNINTNYGIKKANELIKLLSLKVKRIVKNRADLFKGKIDEFIVIAPYKHKDEINKLVNKLYTKLNKEVNVKGNIIIPSVRIGVAFNKIDGNNLDDLINKASSISLSVKNEEKKIAFYNKDYEEKIRNYFEIKNELMRVISNNNFDEFKIYYQPQIDKYNKLGGMEALIRWFHPTKGLIPPNEFLSVAINEGMIKKIDLWTMENVIKQIKKWLDEGFCPGVVSCNITMQQLESKDFVNKFKQLIKKHDFYDKLKYFGIEVTEESIMNNSYRVIKTLNELKQLGIVISLDDFGTGYANLTKLKEFPIDKLKIDKSFIDGVPNNKDDVALTKIAIEVGKILNYKLIAEGVENKIQRDFIFENGVDYIQGYFYSKPLPADEVVKRVKEIEKGLI